MVPVPSSNQNANAIQQAIQVLSAKIDTALQGFEVRVSKVEVRMDRLEETQRVGTQWANDQHAAMLREVTRSLQETELRIVEKLNVSATNLQQAEIRLNSKIDERQNASWGARLTMLIASFGWILSLALTIIDLILRSR